MNKERSFSDCFTFGLCISFFWHLFWGVFFCPVLEKPFFRMPGRASVFLGTILQKADFSVRPVLSLKAVSPQISDASGDFSKPLYFLKNSQGMTKPAVRILPVDERRKVPVEARRQEGRPVVSRSLLRDAVFGLSDFQDYISNADFSDLAAYLKREDFLSFAEVDVLLSATGAVQSIKKITGCGDPAVDLIVMRKLKNAVFKERFAKGVWVRIRFDLGRKIVR